MNIIYASSAPDYARPLAAPCADIHGVRIMLAIVGHIMHNYEVVREPDGSF